MFTEFSRDGDVIVEVGCWLGASTAYLARAARSSGKNIRIFAVDTWKGTPGEAAHQNLIQDNGGDIFPLFWENMCRLSLQDYVTPIQLPSTEAAGKFPLSSLRMVFIDANHNYEAVREDILVWKLRVKKDGWIGGHDYFTCPDVTRAVNEIFPSLDEWSANENTWLKVI